MKYCSSQFLTSLTVKTVGRGMLRVVSSNCQLFQRALYIKVLRWNTSWLESVSVAVDDLIPVLRMGTRIPPISTHLLWSTWSSGQPLVAPLQRYASTALTVHMVKTSVWEPWGSSLSVDSDPYFSSQVSVFQNIGWSPLVSLWALLWDGYSALSCTQHMLK